jgi:RimJ/RimL family protein N-acetyltransferase
MSTKDLAIKKQLMLLKSKRALALLLASLVFTLENPILSSEFNEDGSNNASRTATSSLKRLKTMHEDDSEKLKAAKGDENKVHVASEADVELIRGKIAKSKKNPPDNYFWHIFYHHERAGKVSIDLIDEPPLGRHASIQIFLNKKSQGMHIGRIAYAKACNMSHYDFVYASMRNNNVPSFRAAQAAGFKELKNPAFSQVLLRWARRIK